MALIRRNVSLRLRRWGGTGACAAILALLLGSGCATAPKEAVLARVDGAPITEKDLGYALSVSHRREDLSATSRSIDIRQYVDKLVDDRLIYDEAVRMGMLDYPEVTGAVDAFILRESVVRLHNEEVVSKIDISDADVRAEYDANYVQLGVIEVGSEEEARRILDEFRAGAGFHALAEKYSTHVSKAHGGEIMLNRKGLTEEFRGPVSSLRPGEMTEPISKNSKFYLLMRFAPDTEKIDGFQKVRDDLRETIRKRLQKEREDAYLKRLKEGMTIVIHDSVLDTIDLEADQEVWSRLGTDTRVLAEVDGSVITVRDFVDTINAGERKTKKPAKTTKEILQSMVDYKVVNIAAMNRQYALRSELGAEVERYRSYLLRNLFFKKVIGPQITSDEAKVRDYYERNLKKFTRPASYRLQQITVKSRREAEDVLESLKFGTDFLWLAKAKLGEDEDIRNAELGWSTIERLPAAYAKVVPGMKIGDVSPVLERDGVFSVIRLQGKQDEVVEDFAAVRQDASKAHFEDAFRRKVEEYLAVLRKDSVITMNEAEIEAYEQKIGK